MFTSNKEQKIKDYNISDNECIADFHLRSKNRNFAINGIITNYKIAKLVYIQNNA